MREDETSISKGFGGAMFDVDDWIDRLVKAGGRIKIDTIQMTGVDPVSVECRAIWNEIRPPANSDKTNWKAVEAEIRRRVGPVGPGWTIYPDDARR